MNVPQATRCKYVPTPWWLARSTGVGVLLLVASIWVLIPACERRSETLVPTVITESPGKPSPSVAPARRLAIGPITYFQQSCARCHGSMGSMYADTMAQADDTKRRAEIVRMVAGPAQSSLGADETESLVELHRAMAKGEPFVVVVGSAADGLQIEATPGAAVWVEASGRDGVALRDAAERTGEWTWRWIPAEGQSPVRVVADVAGVVVWCDAKPSASSHDDGERD